MHSDETGNRRSQQSNVQYSLDDISDFKNPVKAGATIDFERMEIRKSVKPQLELFWKRRIENDIARLRINLSRLDDWFKGKQKKDGKRKKEELRNKYSIKVKGFKVVIEELKQIISAKSEKLRRYGGRGNQYKQNKLFRCNQKASYPE